MARKRKSDDENRLLSFAFDSGFLGGAHPPDSEHCCDEEEEDVDDGKRVWAHLASSFRMLSGSLLRSGIAETEMAKAKEAAFRAESERRRAESEAQITDMILRTQLQIATFLSQNPPRRKRKRDQPQQGVLSPLPPSYNDGDDDGDNDEMWNLLMLGLLQCNLRF